MDVTNADGFAWRALVAATVTLVPNIVGMDGAAVTYAYGATLN